MNAGETGSSELVYFELLRRPVRFVRVRRATRKLNRPLVPFRLRNFGRCEIALQRPCGIGQPRLGGFFHMG